MFLIGLKRFLHICSSVPRWRGSLVTTKCFEEPSLSSSKPAVKVLSFEISKQAAFKSAVPPNVSERYILSASTFVPNLNNFEGHYPKQVVLAISQPPNGYVSSQLISTRIPSGQKIWFASRTTQPLDFSLNYPTREIFSVLDSLLSGALDRLLGSVLETDRKDSRSTDACHDVWSQAGRPARARVGGRVAADCAARAALRGRRAAAAWQE